MSDVWQYFASLSIERDWVISVPFPKKYNTFRVRFEQPSSRGIAYIGLALDDEGRELYDVRKLYPFENYQIVQFDPLLMDGVDFRLAIKSTTLLNNSIFIDMPISLLDPSSFGNSSAATAVEAAIPASQTPIQIREANPTRKELTIFNTSNGRLHLKLSAYAAGANNAQAIAASTISIPANATYEFPVNYTGAVYGVFASNNGDAKVIEFV